MADGTTVQKRSATDTEPTPAPDKSLLKQRAYEGLKERIQNSTFEAGAFLSERQLAAQLGMSKTPVKAALERLEAEGFISVSPQQGIVVRDLSIHEIADQFEIRLALESFVLRSISGKLSDERAAKLRQQLRLQQQAVKRRDVAQAARLDSEFHTTFCEFLGNQAIVRVMLQLREKMHRVVTRVFQQHADRLARSFEEHLAIVEAVLAGQPDQAVAALEEHLNHGKQLLLSRGR